MASAAACCALVGAAVPAAQADVYETGFEAPSFTPLGLDGQGGWSKAPPGLDAAIFAHTAPTQGLGLGDQSLRISNHKTDPAIKQVLSPSVTEAAGESETGAPHRHFDASFRFAAFKPEVQPGLSVHVAPDDGNGSRTATVRIQDAPDGLRVESLDPVDNGPGAAQGWLPYKEIASGLARGVPHTLRFSIDYADGPSDDVLRIYVDGQLVHTAVTWEQYYRNDPEQAVNGNQVPVTSSLLLSARTTWDQPAGGPAAAGEGFFFDDVRIETSTAVGPPQPTPPKPTPGPPVGTPRTAQLPPAEDARPMKLRVGGSGVARATIRQNGFLERRAITLPLRCNERCTVRASGRLSVRLRGKRIRLKVVRRTLRPGAKATIAIRLSPDARRLVRRNLRRGKAVKAQIVLRVRDSAGQSQLVRRTVRLGR